MNKIDMINWLILNHNLLMNDDDDDYDYDYDYDYDFLNRNDYSRFLSDFNDVFSESLEEDEISFNDSEIDFIILKLKKSNLNWSLK